MWWKKWILCIHNGIFEWNIKKKFVLLSFHFRFNAAQYGSFLLNAAAGSSAGRFPSQCGVKGESGGWGSGRYHHELSDLHLADYSAVAAAAHSHYSNAMTAGNSEDYSCIAQFYN